MKPITNIASVQEAGDSKRMPAGAYICKYTKVEDNAEKSYLYMEFDVVEGEYKGYFEELADRLDFWAGKCAPKSCLPIGAVLTIPAAGSEMSNSCVITNDTNNDKRGINSNLCRCKFCVMNPERTFTLPPYQTAAGATDIMMHTMERYFSVHEDMTLTDALAEALMKTVKDSALEVMARPTDYRHRAQIMWPGIT